MLDLEYDYLEEIKHFVEVVKTLKTEYKEYLDRERELAGLKRDIYHIYELCDLDTVDLVKVSEIYSEKLKERREVIDNKRMMGRFKALFDKKYGDLIDELLYVVEKTEEDKNKDRRYYAKSELGQDLIDEFSTIEDDLVKSPSDEDLEGLKSLEKKFNVGG